MIALRRAADRHHDKGRKLETWLTFDEQDRAALLVKGLANIEILKESRLAPAPGASRDSFRISMFAKPLTSRAARSCSSKVSQVSSFLPLSWWRSAALRSAIIAPLLRQFWRIRNQPEPSRRTCSLDPSIRSKSMLRGTQSYPPIPPIPPISPCAPSPAFSLSPLLRSAISTSVVSISAATEAAFCRATRTTLVGSMTPARTRSSYLFVATL